MALLLIEGMDKVGKSTVAEYFRREKRYEYIHMTVPAKWHTRDTYFAEMLHLIAMTAGKNVVIDRTWYGECVWPAVFGRSRLLSNWDMQALFEAATALHNGLVDKIHMHDPDTHAHMARIKAYKEPTYDFDKARSEYENMVYTHSFDKLTFQEAESKGWI